MNDFLIVNDEDMNFLWETVQQQQLVFHPYIAPEGQFDYSKFFASKRKKPFMLSIDRNILSSLIKFCENGSLKNKEESQIVGIIMAWARMNDIPITAGQSVQERSTQTGSQEEGLSELQKFFEIIEKYPGQMWLEVAEGRLTDIPPIVFSQSLAQNISVDFSSGGDHYDMAVASLLHAVQLYRNKTMKPIDPRAGAALSEIVSKLETLEEKAACIWLFVRDRSQYKGEIAQNLARRLKIDLDILQGKIDGEVAKPFVVPDYIRSAIFSVTKEG